MTIYNIPQMAAVAFSRAMTIENISSGFRVTGIYPFDPNVHAQEDFAPLLVIDRPNPDVCEPGTDTTPVAETWTEVWGDEVGALAPKIFFGRPPKM